MDFDDLMLLHVRYPKRVAFAGAVLAYLGAFGLLFGALANVGRAAGQAVAAMGAQVPPVSMLQLWPGMPTWWVPESLAGLLLYATFLALGIMLSLAAKEGERIWKSL